MTYEKLFLMSLFWTVVIETIVLFLALWLVFKKDFKDLSKFKILFTGIVASMATIPYLWFVLPKYLPVDNFVLIGEILVVLAETIIIKYVLNLGWQKAFILSILCNVISYFFGLVIF
ncbi:hypothetical protein KJ855_01380 [Patescibacteria group bacterium]|nr:hypothetical protein [Patescibacteria group bacterium]